MKYPLIAASLIVAPLALADDDHAQAQEHHHDDHFTRGPNGGQLVKTEAGFSLEVVVDKLRMARITLLDEKGKATAPGKAEIRGIAGERSSPVKLVFAKGEGDDAALLISDKALPAGHHVSMILVIKRSPDAKAVTERFELHLD